MGKSIIIEGTTEKEKNSENNDHFFIELSLFPYRERDYQEAEKRVMDIRRKIKGMIKSVYLKNIFVPGVAGIIGQIFDRGSGNREIVAEGFGVSIDDYFGYDKEINLLSPKVVMGDDANKDFEEVFVGIFKDVEKKEEAFKYAQETGIPLGVSVNYPEITKRNATRVALEISRLFGKIKGKYLPNKIYWATDMPWQMMPLVSYLARATGHITFLARAERASYVEAFTLM